MKRAVRKAHVTTEDRSSAPQRKCVWLPHLAERSFAYPLQHMILREHKTFSSSVEVLESIIQPFVDEAVRQGSSGVVNNPLLA